MHRYLYLPLFLLPALASSIHACAAAQQQAPDGAGGSETTAAGTGGAGGVKPPAPEDDGGFVGISDAQSEEPPFGADAACATATEEAEATALPVDIIWVVDNSSSMQPAIAEITSGLSSFAALIGAKSLDYQVIMLALRSKTSPVTIGGSKRYPVCIPPPLAGDDACGDGPRFFQSSIDIRSTQTLEQLLGTLGQTAGYTAADARGGEPWAQHLRAQATKTIVVVSDDNGRLSATDFETFSGGKNPFNSLTLPPGILDPSWNGLFKGYLFSGIYGWGSDTDPSVKCSFPDQTQPASSGATYTTLVQKTGGVRAKICAGAAAWQPFFEAVAQAVISTAKLSCELKIPTPTTGTVDPTRINVAIESGSGPVYLPSVDGAAACGAGAGWYYDDPTSPTRVTLCPASCDAAQGAVGPGKPGHIQVLFGCTTVVK